MTFEQGFHAGERAAFADRDFLRKRDPPAPVNAEFDRGWLAGYHPRGEKWRLRTIPQAMAWYAEKEDA